MYRHMVNNGEPEDEEYDLVHKAMIELANQLEIHTVQLSHRHIVDSKTDAGSRRRYRNAFQSIRNTGMRESEANVHMFVKIEKWEEHLIESGKVPRAIQFRGYGYCGMLSTYLKPIEDALWKFTEENRPVFSKGRNSFEVARMLRDAWDDGYTVWFLLDHSKFDSSIMTRWTKLMAEFYMRFWSEPQLAELLKSKLRNRSYTKGGSIYSFKARLCSGDYDTSLVGNTLNYLVLTSICKRLGITAAKIINGDDSCLGMRPKDRATFEKWFCPRVMKRYGLQTKMEVVTEFEQIDFCQCKPVEMNEGIWRMVRDPRRILSRSIVSVRRYEGKAWLRLISAIADSELACNYGMPITQAWALALKKAARGAKALEHEFSHRSKLEERAGERPVTNVARESYARAFGISPSQQMLFEDWTVRQPVQALRSLPGLEKYLTRQ